MDVWRTIHPHIKATVIEDSIGEHGIRLTTLALAYHRYIHGEFMTHRVFSRNASSSRAIPVMTIIKQVWNDPVIPVHWGANMPGMQAKEELTGWRKAVARKLWKGAAKVACVIAYGMTKAGLHKQVANRILEPWQQMHVIVTATEWENFFNLRDHPDAQPEIRILAARINLAMASSIPTFREFGGWHLPYVSSGERCVHPLLDLIKMSAARCARVSYLTHDGKKPDPIKDIALYDRLVGSVPIHASPVEHQATPYLSSQDWCANFRGWEQHRQTVEESFASK
jgi:hypothetical protein